MAVAANKPNFLIGNLPVICLFEADSGYRVEITGNNGARTSVFLQGF
jgi:hypothetical protein